MFVLAVTSVFASVNKISKTKVVSSNVLPLIVIDAGHGGFDGGCVGIDGTLEKEINLSVSLQLSDILQQLGFKTLLIRDNDCSVETNGTTIREKKKSDIRHRFSYMKKHSGCVYLSIHQNQYSASSILNLGSRQSIHQFLGHVTATTTGIPGLHESKINCVKSCLHFTCFSNFFLI